MEEEINIVNYLRVVWNRRLFLLLFVLTTTCVTMVVVMRLPKTYQSRVVILPLGMGSGSQSALRDVLRDVSFLGLDVKGQTSSSRLMAIFRSRTLAERVIGRVGLMSVFFPDEWDIAKNDWKEPDSRKRSPFHSMEYAVQIFFSEVHILQERDLTITITSISYDPDLAARIVNGVVDELQAMISENAYTMAKKQRLFIENQLQELQKELLLLGKMLSEYYGSQLVSASNAAIDVILPKSPQPGGEMVSKSGDDSLVVKAVPQQSYLDYLMMRKDILEQVHGLLHSQYAAAKIEEAREDISFQVIDPGLVPVIKYGPKRRKITVYSFLLSAFLALSYVMVSWHLQQMKNKKSME